MGRRLTVSVILVVVISTGLVSCLYHTTRRRTTSNFNIFRTTTRQYTRTTPQFPYGPTSDCAFWGRRTTSTPPPTTTCPFPCMHNGRMFCGPLPCHITCVDFVQPPGQCCYECPNGPNCSYGNRLVPEGHYINTTSGLQVHCLEGGPMGGFLDIRRSTAPIIG